MKRILAIGLLLAIGLVLAIGAHAQAPATKAQPLGSQEGAIEPLSQEKPSAAVSRVIIDKPTKSMSTSAPADATWCPTGCKTYAVVTHSPGGGQTQTVMCRCGSKAAYESIYN